MTATTKNAPGIRGNGPEGSDHNPTHQDGAEVMPRLPQTTDAAQIPAWAAGHDILDEGTPDEWRCYWSLSIPVPGALTDGRDEHDVLVFAEQTTDTSPEDSGPFVVLDINTDAARRARLTPPVARLLALQLLHHAEMLTEEAGR